MKSILFTILAVSMVATISIAATFEKDDGGTKTTSPAYHGGLSQTLAASPGTTIDMRTNVNYSVYCAAEARERAMFGNYTKSQKVPFVQTPIPATTWHTQAVNKTTPFVNISGCAGWLRRQ